MFTLKPFLVGGGGGDVKSVSRGAVNSMEENSEDFCPIYFQEFGLCTGD